MAQAQQQFNTVEQQFNSEKITFEKIDAEQTQQHQFEIKHQEKIELVRARIAERRLLGEQLLKTKDELKFLQDQHLPLVNHENLIKVQLYLPTNMRMGNESPLMLLLKNTTLFKNLWLIILSF